MSMEAEIAALMKRARLDASKTTRIHDIDGGQLEPLLTSYGEVYPPPSRNHYKIDVSPVADGAVRVSIHPLEGPGGLRLAACVGDVAPSVEDEDCRWQLGDEQAHEDGKLVLTIMGSDEALSECKTVSLSIFCTQESRKAFRIKTEHVLPCAAIDLELGSPLTMENGAEFTYFRVKHDRPGELLSIRASPCMDDSGEAIGDPDLYISNAAGGIGAVTKENFVWKSTNVGADRIDIHPRDARAADGNVYVIGVLGYRERNRWTVVAESMAPKAIETLSVGTDMEAQVTAGDYAYYEIDIDQSHRSRLTIQLIALDEEGGEEKTVEPNFAFGRGVYTQEAELAWDRPKSAADKAIRPQLLLSNTCMYPTVADYTWRSVTRKGAVEAVIECDEWKFATSRCHLAVYAAPPKSFPDLSSDAAKEDGVLPSDATDVELPAGEDKLRYRITVTEVYEEDALGEEVKASYAFYKELFATVDGGSMSQQERASRGLTGDNSFTYGEVDYLSFITLLRMAAPKEGEVFYDLGCGTGKALVIAAINFPFSKAVGIELLDKLFTSATASVDAFRAASDCEVPIELKHGSFLEIDFSEADVVYTSSICFTPELMEGMAEAAKAMKPGSRFITLKLLPGHEAFWAVESSGWFKMSWGRTTVYILRRLAEGEKPHDCDKDEDADAYDIDIDDDDLLDLSSDPYEREEEALATALAEAVGSPTPSRAIADALAASAVAYSALEASMALDASAVELDFGGEGSGSGGAAAGSDE